MPQGNYQEYNIGYNPETTQDMWGNPQVSQFGNAIRGGFSPLGGANYEWFPFEPYYWPTNFFGEQVAGITPPEYLWAEFYGYRGVLPMALQDVSPEPYPYDAPYYQGYSA